MGIRSATEGYKNAKGYTAGMDKLAADGRKKATKAAKDQRTIKA